MRALGGTLLALGLVACGGGNDTAERKPPPPLPKAFQGVWASSTDLCAVEPENDQVVTMSLGPDFIDLPAGRCSFRRVEISEDQNEVSGGVFCVFTTAGTGHVEMRVRGDTLMVNFEDEGQTYSRCLAGSVAD